MFGCHPLGRRRRTTEVDGRHGVGLLTGGGGHHAVVGSVEVVGIVGPRSAHHLDELGSAFVAFVMGQVITEAGQLGGLGAGDDVHHEPATGHPLVGRGHLGRQRGRHASGPKRNQEPDAVGPTQQRCRGHPGVLAHGAGGSEHGFKAQTLSGQRHLQQVAGIRWAAMVVGPSGRQHAAVAAGRQKPVQLHEIGHAASSH